MSYLSGALLQLLLLLSGVAARFNEYKPGPRRLSLVESPLPGNYIHDDALPAEFNWGNNGGTSYLTKVLNQHLPQYCGSCWAHGALSSLADRIKIARGAKGTDINLSVQFILNCGTAGSCLGGDHHLTYKFISERGYVPYDNCQPYEACSSDSTEGKCKTKDYSCTPVNVCRVCSSFVAMGGTCRGITTFPNASVAEYGRVKGAKHIMKEILARGPVACGVNADPMDNYTGGIMDFPSAPKSINHIVSLVGWGTDAASGRRYWIGRNNWGEMWGEMGFFRVFMGENQLALEEECAWATPGSWTETNYPCYEDGSNCVVTAKFRDPSRLPPGELLRRRLGRRGPTL